MKNLLCALSILTVCTASNLTNIYIFDSLTILSNHSAELVLKTEESNNETDNETVDTVLKTVVNVANLNEIVGELFENQLEVLNFTYPDVFLQQGDNESEELNTKHLKNEESLPRNEETICIDRTMENLDDLQKNDKLQTLIKILDFLVKHIKDVIKSTLNDVLLNLLKGFTDKQILLLIIDEIANVLRQTSDLMQIKPDDKTIDFINGITKTENEIQSKLLKLYMEARVIYEDMYSSKFSQNSQNEDKLIETSIPVFDDLDKLNGESEKNKSKKKNKVSSEKDKIKKWKNQEREDWYNRLLNYYLLIDNPYPIDNEDIIEGPLFHLRKTQSLLQEKGGQKEDLFQGRYSSILGNEGLHEGQFPKIYHDSSLTRRPFKMATDLDINAANADGMPKDIKNSFAEVYGLPKFAKKNVDVTGKQDKESITDVLKRKNAHFAMNYILRKKKMRDLPGKLKKREDHFIVPSQRGMFDYFGSENRNSEMENIDQVSKNVIEAILEGIDEVIPPSNGEYETLRYKKPVLTKDPFFEEILKDESEMDMEKK